jgi:hypothetical protein
MSGRFQAAVASVTDLGAELALTHVTDGEALLYFFYGRPSYRIHLEQTPSTYLSYAPICFLLRANAGIVAKRARVQRAAVFRATLAVTDAAAGAAHIVRMLRLNETRERFRVAIAEQKRREEDNKVDW